MLHRTLHLVMASQLGVVLYGARKNLKLTQAQLGERLGLSQRRVSESVDQLMAMCAQLGLQLTVQPREQTPQTPGAQTEEW